MNRNSSAFTIITGLLALTLLAGCSGGHGGPGGFSMPPMPVEVTQATVKIVADRFEAVGSIEALEAITVVSQIDAAVVALPFQEGSPIGKGDLIAQLDDSQLAAELKRAEALHTQSHTNYDRIKSVVDQKAGTQQDLDDAGAGLKVADANLALATARLEKTRITAPFSGVIGARRVSVGTFLRTGDAITELANIDEIRVSFSAPERFLGQLARGADVTVSTPAIPNYEVHGKIIAIEPMVDPGTRNARIIGRVPNPGRKFRPGMSADVKAVLSERPNAVTIPNEAVFASGNQTFVYIVKSDSTAARVPVILGTRLSDIVEVVSGVSPGTMVVRAGHQKLFDGARVMPVASTATSVAQQSSGQPQ
jgi:membrane fusion protein, multidrug efflux system